MAKAKSTKLDNSLVTDIPHEEVPNASTVDAGSVQVINLTPEQQAKNEIAKFNVADAGIASLNRKYGSLKIEGIEDKDGYKKVYAAWQEVREKRIGVEKKHKEIKSDYLTISRAIDAEKNRLVDKLKPLEDKLGDEVDRIDALKKEEKERAEREAQERLQARVNALIENGMQFNGSFYSIGEQISMDVISIKDMNDEQFSSLMEKVELEHIKILEAEAEKERQEQEERDRLKRQQEEQARKEQEQKEEQARLDREREELLEEKRTGRREILIGMDFEQDGLYWKYSVGSSSCVVYFGDLALLDADQWKSILEDAKHKKTYTFNEAKEKAEADRKEKEQAEAERLRIEQERKEREQLIHNRISEVVNIGLSLSDDKKYYQIRGQFTESTILVLFTEIEDLNGDQWRSYIHSLIKKVDTLKHDEKVAEQQKKDAEEKERQQNLSDREKYSEYLKKLLAIPFPEFATDYYQECVDNVASFISKSLDNI